MPTVRHVPVYYPTIQVAHDAANPGDTILIDPGVYSDQSQGLTKRVHLIGNTPDPGVSGSVVIQSTGANPAIMWLSSPGPGDLLIEGVQIYKGKPPLLIPGPANGLRLHINRCRFFNSSTAGAGSICFGHSSPLFLRITNCDTHCWWYTGAWTWQLGGGAENDVRISGIERYYNESPFPLNLVTSPASDPYEWAGFFYDVKAEEAGAGYGWEQGELLRTSFMTDGYVLWGVAGENLPPEFDRSQIELRVLRQHSSGTIERNPWAVLHPNPITGEFSVQNLPTDHTYWVEGILEGYRPQIDGPFVPGQN